MGAAGLTSSSVEMASKGSLGMNLNLDLVPTREDKMSSYEIMLSESQERMLMILKPGSEEKAKLIFDKWDLDFAIIGEVTNTGRLILTKDGFEACNLPLKPLVEDAPEYNKPYEIKTNKKVYKPSDLKTNLTLMDILITIFMMSSSLIADDHTEPNYSKFQANYFFSCPNEPACGAAFDKMMNSPDIKEQKYEAALSRISLQGYTNITLSLIHI